MQINRKYLAIGATVVALGAAGTGVAVATSGDGSDRGDAAEQVSGADATKARDAALAITGGGTANSVERDDENGATWEVEVSRPDGQTVDVRLDASFGRVAVESDSEEAGDDD